MGFFNNQGTGGGEIDLSALDSKVDKVSGKGLSTNDYTTEEKTKLSGIATSANNYTHPASHVATMITQSATHRFVSDTEKALWNGKVDSIDGKGLSTNDYTTEEKTKLSGVATGANNYTHPSSHAASMITQSSTARFVSDTEKATWNGKADNIAATVEAMGLVKKCEAQEDSVATDIETLVADFNSLLGKLRSAGIM